MNAIVILCGGNSSGKTTTIKRFFEGKFTTTYSGRHFFERVLDGKRLYAVSSESPHEKVEDFCNVGLVNEDIKKRTDECDKKADGQDYILIIPFTMSVSQADREKLNEDCILRPIEKLKERHNVFVVYLRKKNAKNLEEKDAFMKRIAFNEEIGTTRDDYDKSVELEVFIKEKIIKTL